MSPVYDEMTIPKPTHVGMDHRLNAEELFDRMCEWDDHNFLMAAGSKEELGLGLGLGLGFGLGLGLDRGLAPIASGDLWHQLHAQGVHAQGVQGRGCSVIDLFCAVPVPMASTLSSRAPTCTLRRACLAQLLCCPCLYTYLRPEPCDPASTHSHTLPMI